VHTLLSHALLRRWGRDYAARGGEAQGSAYEDGKRRSTRATRGDYSEFFDDDDEDQDDGGSDEFKARTARIQEVLRVEMRRRGNNMTKAYRRTVSWRWCTIRTREATRRTSGHCPLRTGD
jgi:hypothetical protein